MKDGVKVPCQVSEPTDTSLLEYWSHKTGVLYGHKSPLLPSHQYSKPSGSSPVLETFSAPIAPVWTRGDKLAFLKVSLSLLCYLSLSLM